MGPSVYMYRCEKLTRLAGVLPLLENVMITGNPLVFEKSPESTPKTPIHARWSP